MTQYILESMKMKKSKELKVKVAEQKKKRSSIEEKGKSDEEIDEVN